MKKKITTLLKMAKGWLSAHPVPTIVIAMMVFIIIDLSYAAINFLTIENLMLAYASGLILIIPSILIVIVIFTSSSKKKESDHQKAIRDKDKELSTVKAKLRDGKTAIEKGKQDSRSYESLKKTVAKERTEHQEIVAMYEKYIDYFKTLYDRDEFSRRICKFAAFCLTYVEALDLFDPVLYLADRVYSGWVNSNVKSWNQIIDEYTHSPQMAITRIRNSQKSNKPKKMSSDSSPVLEKEKDVESRPKKLNNISLDDDGR